LAIAEASLGGAPDATFQEVSQVVGKRLVRSVNQGELVLRNHMEAPQMIRKGAVVTLVAERGLLKVTARGVALEGGEMGKVIRVKNLSSKKTVFARVIGSSTVRVDL
jgi:flagella basal body P-ring formation protein FlgA